MDIRFSEELSPKSKQRRNLLKSIAAAAGAGAVGLPAAAAPAGRPKLGVVAQVTGKATPEKAIAHVHELGFSTCQVAVGMSPDGLAKALKAALDQYGIEATAAMTQGEGKMVWDFDQGPLTIGLVPRPTRAARIDALKRASDLAKQCGIKAVHTHCGFIPEVPSDPLYAETVKAIHDVASHCRANGQYFLMETGQESPITMLRAIEDVGLDNVAVNLDTANLILYGKGEPLGALEVIGKYVRGVHAKDGLYPTNPRKLGEEVAIGKGRANLPAVIQALRKLNYTGPITIEREISGAQQEADIRASKKYLESLIDQSYGA